MGVYLRMKYRREFGSKIVKVTAGRRASFTICVKKFFRVLSRLRTRKNFFTRIVLFAGKTSKCVYSQFVLFTSYIIRVAKSVSTKSAEHAVRMEEMRNAYKTLVGNPEGKRLLLRPGRRWKNNIKMAHKEIRCELVSRLPLAGSCVHGSQAIDSHCMKVVRHNLN
jgi:hypothetical protein